MKSKYVLGLIAGVMAHALGITHAEEILKLSGKIDADSVDRLALQLRSKPFTLIVNSGGGESEPAMRLGRIMRNRDATLVIDSACLSACATFLIPAAKQVLILDQAIVGFHHTDSALFYAFSGKFPVQARQYLRGAERERAYFEQMKANEGFLLIPTALVGVSCVHVMSRENGEPLPVFRLNADFWVPSSKDLALLNRNISGHVASAEEASQTISKLEKPGMRRLTFISGEFAKVSNRQAANALSRVPTCRVE